MAFRASLRMAKATISFAVLFFLATTSTWAVEARLDEVNGKVEWQAPKAAEWVPAQNGTVLPVGGKVLTGPDSNCQILIDQSRVKLVSESHATLESVDPVRIDLTSGRIFSLVRGLKKGATFEVKMPTAIAAARGTGWTQSGGGIDVYEDTVHLTGSNGDEEDVGEGQGIDINPDGSLGDLRDASGDLGDEFNNFNDGGSDDGNSGGGGNDEGFGNEDDMNDAKEDMQQGSSEDNSSQGGSDDSSGKDGGDQLEDGGY